MKLFVARSCFLLLKSKGVPASTRVHQKYFADQISLAGTAGSHTCEKTGGDGFVIRHMEPLKTSGHLH